jgi:hypothetical protein
MLPSSVLFATIVFGGLLAVVGNTLYPLAREQEKRARLAGDAWTILRPEIAENKLLSTQMQAELDKGTIDVRKLDVSGWETISRGGLLLGLGGNDIRKLLLVYKKCYEANEKNAQLSDLLTGIRSTLNNRDELVSFYRASVKITLTELDQAIAGLNATK